VLQDGKFHLVDMSAEFLQSSLHLQCPHNAAEVFQMQAGDLKYDLFGWYWKWKNVEECHGPHILYGAEVLQDMIHPVQ
jgi:hypothetical protein